MNNDLIALNNSGKANSELYDRCMEGNADPFGILERFSSPCKDSKRGVKLSLNITTSEFTSLCPITSQPDFAKIVIDYIPDQWCVESKSLKLYFLTFRNRRDFHESCVTKIANDLIELLDPSWLKVTGEFTPRGGIPFWPTCEYKKK